MKLTTEQIKKSSKIAARGFHIPQGFSKEIWEHNMLMCIRAELFVPNEIRNAAEIKEKNKQAEKLAKKVVRK